MFDVGIGVLKTNAIVGVPHGLFYEWGDLSHSQDSTDIVLLIIIVEARQVRCIGTVRSSRVAHYFQETKLF